MDMTRAANSGHPGGAFSSCDFAAILFKDYLKYDASWPHWPNRDRFVLSAGHESALQYSLLHLWGLLSMDDLKAFRQLGSKTPGHPEVGVTPGVEATTGPLGQGVAMGVGMAMAEAHQRTVLGDSAINHRTYVLCSDGDLQEDVALGACALAGHWGLGRLVMFYDKNDVQISGKTDRVSSTDFHKLFEAMNWRVVSIDGQDGTAIRLALDSAIAAEHDQPTLIIGQTTIAAGSYSMGGSPKSHGEPFHVEEIAATRKLLQLLDGESFSVTPETYSHFNVRQPELKSAAEAWQESHLQQLGDGQSAYAKQWSALMEGMLPAREDMPYPTFPAGESLATRVAFGKCLEAVALVHQGLIGGSADLEPSNNTGAFAKAVGEFSKEDYSGRNVAFGVREFAMAAIGNGLSLKGMTGFGATFLTFSDYMRNAIRMSALQKLGTIQVFTHDSLFLGEDGPTHQPVEHTMSLRLIPELLVMRPGDALETVECLDLAFRNRTRPSALLLTRQNVPTLGDECAPASLTSKGAYVKFDNRPGKVTQVIVFATGSELSLAIEAAKALTENIKGNIRIVSVPCWELFEEQNQTYREEIMAWEVPFRVSLEAGSTLGWQKFTGARGLNIGMDTFGESAPGPALAKHFGFTVEAVTQKIEHYVSNSANGVKVVRG